MELSGNICVPLSMSLRPWAPFLCWNQARSREDSDVCSEQPGRGDERSASPKLGLAGQISGTGLAWFAEPWPEYHNLESGGIVRGIVGISRYELL